MVFRISMIRRVMYFLFCVESGIGCFYSYQLSYVWLGWLCHVMGFILSEKRLTLFFLSLSACSLIF